MIRGHPVYHSIRALPTKKQLPGISWKEHQGSISRGQNTTPGTLVKEKLGSLLLTLSSDVCGSPGLLEVGRELQYVLMGIPILLFNGGRVPVLCQKLHWASYLMAIDQLKRQVALNGNASSPLVQACDAKLG